MKNWHLCALLAIAAPSMAAAAGDEIEVVSAGATSVITLGDSFGSTNFNGWNITATGSSASPGLIPSFGLQVNATCLSGNCLTNSLNVFFTSAGFTSVPSNATFGTSFATSETAGETSRAITWAASDSGVPPTPFLGGLPGVGPDHIGTVTLASNGFSSTMGNPSAGLTPPYDLTIEESFTDTTNSVATFSAASSVTAAPEVDPASAMGALTLLAGGLAMLRGRRRKN